MLPWAIEDALSGWRRCCQSWLLLLLQGDADYATDGSSGANDGGRLFYRRQPAVLSPADGLGTKVLSTLLPTVAGDATNGSRRCCQRWTTLLQRYSNDATDGRPACCQRRAALLQR